jgi:hypothetical protein
MELKPSKCHRQNSIMKFLLIYDLLSFRVGAIFKSRVLVIPGRML